VPAAPGGAVLRPLLLLAPLLLLLLLAPHLLHQLAPLLRFAMFIVGSAHPLLGLLGDSRSRPAGPQVAAVRKAVLLLLVLLLVLLLLVLVLVLVLVLLLLLL
jgi:hypothetical protein